MTHARRVMDKNELDTVTKLYEEFKAAIDGSDGKVLPEDELVEKRPAIDVNKMRSALKRGFTKNND